MKKTERESYTQRDTQDANLTRRRFLAGATGLVFSGLGLAMAGKVLSENQSPLVLPASSPATETLPTPIPAPHERSDAPERFSILEEHNSWIPEQEIDFINKEWNRFAIFDPMNKIKIVKEGPLSQVVEDTIMLNEKLFSNETYMANRHDIEVPLAILMSIPIKIMNEASDKEKSDWKKEKAWVAYKEQYAISVLPKFPDPDNTSKTDKLKDGIDIFNAYHSFPDVYKEDKVRGESLLKSPTGYFASVATALATRMKDVTDEIQSMPVTYNTHGMSLAEASGQMILDDFQLSGVAKTSIDETYKLLKACAQKKGESRGDGALHNDVSVALAKEDTNYSISALRFDLGMRTE